MSKRTDVEFGPVFTVTNEDGKKVEAVPVSVVTEMMEVSKWRIYPALQTGDVPSIRVNKMHLIPMSFIKLWQRVGWAKATGRKPGPKPKEKK